MECEGCSATDLILGNKVLWYHDCEQSPVYAWWCKECSYYFKYSFMGTGNGGT